MASRRRHRHSGCEDIPTASFSDLAFLLIIFFILATTLVKTHGFTTEFPSGQRSEKPEEKTTTVSLSPGRMMLNDKDVDLPRFREALAALKLHQKAGNEKIVLMQATGKVEYQRYFEVMAAITDAGGTICIVREEGGEP